MEQEPIRLWRAAACWTSDGEALDGTEDLTVGALKNVQSSTGERAQF